MTIRSTLTIRYCLAIAVLVLSGGCSVVKSNKWYPPLFAPPKQAVDNANPLAEAEMEYLAAWRLEQAGDPACIDHYGNAAALAWPFVSSTGDSSTNDRGSFLYRSAVGRFLISASRFDRFDPTVGIATDSQIVPISFYGFPWRPDEFHRFTLVGDYSGAKTEKKFRCCGVGAPLVVSSFPPCCEHFRKSREHFAATAIIRPHDSGYLFEFYDPVRVEQSPHFDQPLARDLSAPLNFEKTDRTEALKNYFLPGSTNADEGLHMLEPYQPGKIPVVFIHGLLSDPQSWMPLYNELRRHPDIVKKFQFMAVEYPTSVPFLNTAARLRRELRQYRCHVDPLRNDPALSEMVLIGHSMGGIIAKLQTIHSCNDMWAAATQRPFAELQTNPETRQRYFENFFFDPSPDVSRVIAIGTPFSGSPWARRPIGRLSARLTFQPHDLAVEYRQLKRQNRGTFVGNYRLGMPLSIDLLKYNNPLILAIRNRPMAPGTSLNLIYGNSREFGIRGESDFIVPVRSAVVPAETARMVDADHLELQRHEETKFEVLCLLRKHAAACAAQLSVEDYDAPPLPPELDLLPEPANVN